MPRDPRSPVLNVHRRRRSRNASSLSTSPSPSNRPPSVGAPGASVSSVAASVGAASLSPGAASLSPDDAARLSSSYTSGKARHYASQGADATVNSSNAPGTEERWLLDSADQLARWAAGVEQEQHTRREQEWKTMLSRWEN